MVCVFLVAVSLLAADVPQGREDKQVNEFLLRLEATPWPMIFPKQERVIRNDDGEITSLKLNGTELQKGDWETLAKFPALRSVSFANTNVSDDDLTTVAKLPGLRGLILDRTSITDAGLAHLTAAPELRSLCLRTTRATSEGVKQLKAAKPKLGVGFGP